MKIFITAFLSVFWIACHHSPCEAQNPRATSKKAKKKSTSPPSATPQDWNTPAPVRAITIAKKRRKPTKNPAIKTLKLKDGEWRQRLTAAQFHVLRRKGTERAFSGKLLHNKKTGLYRCAGCEAPLFSSKNKFRSGTGWPSFSDSLPDRVKRVADHSNGEKRTEIVCARCGGHLGHVFSDGPAPSGERNCVNSTSLKFEGTTAR
jgi:peptide-methionine (R)-S-oxide reductase